ncbi:hypothetical protein Pen02_80570 [Plantactinospora endophytica]|uniref:RNA polymerase sigma factor 70 region 4 type 2 domain-containing protein n=1 Tax=Plantactinospora endophytica TaxID=673535 RepID=A0ABQ4EFS7_9ACTN|nr:hypothetical protein Pen02_80570 [Plantactinospora endophytica]
MLDELSPPQRVAYVLHDLFAVSFDEIGPVLDTTVAAAKKLASRARIRLRDVRAVDLPGSAHQMEIIDAFLAAARGGDIARLVTLLAPDVVRTADLKFSRTAPLLSSRAPGRSRRRPGCSWTASPLPSRSSLRVTRER